MASPESHAASFALLVYVSAWMKCRYPDVFCCALLNAQPMGFYAPAQIVRDAREHGVAIEEADINFSDWNSTLVKGRDEAQSRFHPRHEEMRGDIFSTHHVRLGFRQAKGLNKTDIDVLAAHRGAGYDSIRDLWLRTRPAAKRAAAPCRGRLPSVRLGLDTARGALGGEGLEPRRRQGRSALVEEPEASRRESRCRSAAHVAWRTCGRGLSHIVVVLEGASRGLRARPARGAQILRTEDLTRVENGRRESVAGLVLVRQRPGSAKGVIFLTLEDETGIANAIIWPKLFEALRPIVMAARFIAITGRVQSESGVIHVVAERAEDLTPLLGVLSRRDNEKRADVRVSGL